MVADKIRRLQLQNVVAAKCMLVAADMLCKLEFCSENVIFFQFVRKWGQFCSDEVKFAAKTLCFCSFKFGESFAAIYLPIVSAATTANSRDL